MILRECIFMGGENIRFSLFRILIYLYIPFMSLILIIKCLDLSVPLHSEVLLYIVNLEFQKCLNIILFFNGCVYWLCYLYLKMTKERDYYRSYEALMVEMNLPEKLKIAMFTNNYFPFIGGVPISIQRLADGLRELGHEVFIFAPKYPGHHESSPNVYRVPLLLFYRMKGFDFAVANLWDKKINVLFKEKNFDLVHVHHPFWLGKKGLKLAKKYQIPCVYTYHTRLEKYAHYLPIFKKSFQNLFSHYIIKRFSQQCQAVIAPTKSAKTYLGNIGVSKEKYVIPTGIPEVSFTKQTLKTHNHEVFRMCTVSRLSQEKNLDFLIHAMHLLRRLTTHPFHLSIIGEGAERAHLEDLIQELDLTEVITLEGAIPPINVSHYYAQADLFVYTSLTETQGMVLLEAMAAGCPVVAIRSSGIDDMIFDGYNGYKTKAALKDFVAQIQALMLNPSECKTLGLNALQFANQHSVSLMAEKVVDIYYQMIKQNLYLAKESKPVLKEHYE